MKQNLEDSQISIKQTEYYNSNKEMDGEMLELRNHNKFAIEENEKTGYVDIKLYDGENNLIHNISVSPDYIVGMIFASTED